MRATRVSWFSSSLTEVNEHFKKWEIISEAFLWTTAPLIEPPVITLLDILALIGLKLME